MDQTEAAAPVEIVRAAGLILKAKTTGRVLMLHRVDGMGWSWPGGRIEDGEDAAQCGWHGGWHETFQRTGRRLGDVGAILMRKVKDDGQGLCDYSTFLCPIDEEFPPLLDGEHDAHMWADPEMALAEGGPDRNAMAIADSAEPEIPAPLYPTVDEDGLDAPADEDDIDDETADLIMSVIGDLDRRLSALEGSADPESRDDPPLERPVSRATPVYGSAGASELEKALSEGMEADL